MIYYVITRHSELQKNMPLLGVHIDRRYRLVCLYSLFISIFLNSFYRYTYIYYGIHYVSPKTNFIASCFRRILLNLNISSLLLNYELK